MRAPALWISVLSLAGATSACSYPWPPTNRDVTADQRHAAEAMAVARCDRQTPACTSLPANQVQDREACLDAKAAKSVTESNNCDSAADGCTA